MYIVYCGHQFSPREREVTSPSNLKVVRAHKPKPLYKYMV